MLASLSNILGPGRTGAGKRPADIIITEFLVNDVHEVANDTATFGRTQDEIVSIAFEVYASSQLLLCLSGFVLIFGTPEAEQAERPIFLIPQTMARAIRQLEPNAVHMVVIAPCPSCAKLKEAHAKV